MNLGIGPIARAIQHAVKSLREDRGASIAGIASVELAIIAPVFVGVMVGTVDLGLGFYRKMQIHSAAQVGAAYAASHGFDAGAISNAITATGTWIIASPDPRRFCACASETGLTPVECRTSCPEGSEAGVYVTASAQGVYQTMVPYPGFDNAYPLQAQATVRLQ